MRVAGASHREAWLEVDLAAIVHNVATIRGTLPRGVALAGVVKANAYGHGLVPVGRALDGVADVLCVATLDEGLELRAAGLGERILVLYPVPAAGLLEALHAGLELTVMSGEDARALWAARARIDRPGAANAPGRFAVHLAVDTGMARGGLLPAAVSGVARDLATSPGITLAGIWTHLVSPGDATRSAAQVDDFGRAVDELRLAGTSVPARHVSASGGLFAATAPDLELVRPGLAVYGVLDAELPVAGHRAAAAAALVPAMSLKARAVAYSEVPEGGTVGYGGRWRAARPSRVAILPLGYGDGVARDSQPGAEALVRGRRVPLVGIISMDALAVDVTDTPGVGYDDEFVLLGRDGTERITASDLARTRNTIAWEVLSGMSARLGRVYYPAAGSGQSGSTPEGP